VLKLGTAAPWFTSLVSAETCAFEDVPDPDEALLELAPELPDEQAASSIAALAAAIPNAILGARR
jgi:hypothetical protein